MKRFTTLSLFGLCFAAMFSLVCRADEPPAQTPPAMMEQPKAEQKGAMIKPEEAKDNVGKEVIVEFVVIAGRELEDKGICFLNSSADPSDPAGFTAFITKTGWTKLKSDSQIEHPAEYFNNKKVQVSGKIKKYKDKAEIEISAPSQIKIVEEESAQPKS